MSPELVGLLSDVTHAVAVVLVVMVPTALVLLCIKRDSD